MPDRPPRRPGLATLADDGWTLIDVERAYRVRDGVYWVPPAGARRGLRPGARALLLFAWADAGPEDPGRERLWVEVERVAPDGALVGRLLGEPAAAAPIGEGAEVRARPEHVADLADGPGAPPLSERSDLVRCAGHGWSEPCSVCDHLADGEGLGFHPAADPSRLRPDAWCDACDLLLAAAGGWEAASPRPCTVRVCGGCYDRYRDRNRHPRR